MRFPEFSDVPEPTISLILDEAIAQVGDTWVERDRTPAILYLAAHMLSRQGFGANGGGAGSGTGATGALKRRKVGDVEVEFQGAANSGSGGGISSDYGLTMYGQAYFRLLRRNFPAVAVV